MIRKISSEEVIDSFLGYFKARGHRVIPGASLVPSSDPTLLFINSGMAPLKPYFLGAAKPPAADLCNVQRCIRTNDIDEVGDRHHLTFFEMMGSWSIGHYWKDRAIELAWKLLTEGFGFPQDKLYATVYRGDPGLGIPPDEESIRFWEAIGLPPDHIVPLGVDNFWGPAGESGPCGPCTEVFFDTGDEYGEKYVSGGHFDDVNRYIEIWNAGVFMQYNKQPSGMSKLGTRSVDTGSGLERMVMTLNGFESCYETDLLRPLVNYVESQFGGQRVAPEVARIIADHMRATTMLLADGTEPGPSGRAYIPRRLIRRSIALAHQEGAPRFDFEGLLDLAIGNAKPWNPQVQARKDAIIAAFRKEQGYFESVLGSGLQRLAETASQEGERLSGKTLFTLFSTYGIPVDTAREFMKRRAGSIDEEGFQAEFRRHQQLSRGEAKDAGDEAPGRMDLDDVPATEFLGYDGLQTTAQIVAILAGDQRVQEADAGQEVLLVLDRSTFYPEGGGQVGDVGTIRTGAGAFGVIDTQKAVPGVFMHRGRLESGRLTVGDIVQVAVSPAHRRSVRANHSATHLLHAALRSVLGTDVVQAGSKVDAERLRFDFTDSDRPTLEQLEQIEDLVNDAVRENHAGITKVTSYQDAVANGALAFFGEEYGDRVRMVRFGPVSTELCGGTHVEACGEIGLFLIVSEGSISRGTRRIVAVTGTGALERVREHDRILRSVSGMIRVPVEELEKRVAALAKRDVGSTPNAPKIRPDDLAKQATRLSDGTPVVVAELEVEGAALRGLALDTAAKLQGIACLIVKLEQQVRIAVAVHASRTEAHRANQILSAILPLLGGRGGGKATLAEGSGPNVDAVPRLLEALTALIEAT